MKQAEKTNKIAGQTEKVLPGNAMSVVRANSAPSYSSQTEQSAETMIAGSLATGNVGEAAVLPVNAIAAPIAVNSRDDILERVQEMVALNAVRLSDSGNSSMQVVIKPDAGTQLSLELRRQDGSVEVQAVLRQGDFNHLSQQWPDLQQRLDQRGVRLAPLSDEGAAANSSGGQETFQHKQSHPAEIVPEITLVETPTGMFTPEAKETPAYRGWETWA